MRLFHSLELQPGVVAKLVGKQGAEEAFEHGLRERRVVCGLERKMCLLVSWLDWVGRDRGRGMRTVREGAGGVVVVVVVVVVLLFVA